MLVAGVAQRRVDEFKAQNLANTAWAFATADQSDAPLFALVGRVARQSLGEFNAEDLANTAWAFVTADELDALPLARVGGLTNAWTIFGHVEHIGHAFSPFHYEALLVDCEQRCLVECELTLLNGLEHAAGHRDARLEKNRKSCCTHEPF